MTGSEQAFRTNDSRDDVRATYPSMLTFALRSPRGDVPPPDMREVAKALDEIVALRNRLALLDAALAVIRGDT